MNIRILALGVAAAAILAGCTKKEEAPAPAAEPAAAAAPAPPAADAAAAAPADAAAGATAPEGKTDDGGKSGGDIHPQAPTNQ